MRQQLQIESSIKVSLNEIISLATDGNSPVSDLLRKALVMAYELQNDAMKDWVEFELNGYPIDAELPSYRIINGMAKGFFLGPFNSSLSDQPLTPSVMDKEHRPFAEIYEMRDPVAALDEVKVTKSGTFAVPWSANLVARYQSSFYQGYVLNRAYFEIPPNRVQGIISIIRNRILKFALELQKEFPELNNSELDQVSKSKVDGMVSQIIYAENVVIANNVSDIKMADNSTISITVGDLGGLLKTLTESGVNKSEVGELAIIIPKGISESKKPKEIDEPIKAWIKKVGGRLSEIGIKIAEKSAEKGLTEFIQGYLGL